MWTTPQQALALTRKALKERLFKIFRGSGNSWGNKTRRKAMNRILRWALVLPGAIAAFVVAYPVLYLLNVVLGSPTFLGFSWAELAATGFSGFALVWTAQFIAPSYKYVVAICATLLLVFLCGFEVSAKIWLGNRIAKDIDLIHFSVLIIITLVGAGAACYQAFEKWDDQRKQNKQSQDAVSY